MSDYMKEAERMLDAYVKDERAFFDGFVVDPNKSRAALLAHIQRGAVPEGTERDEWEAVIFTLMGHAAGLYFCGQSDMPNWFYELAEKLARRHVDEALAARVREVGVQQRAMLAAAPAPDHFRDAAKMAPVHCTPTEHDGRIVYEHTSEPIPNADGFVLYAAPAPDRFRAAAKMMAVQPACMTCSGHGMVGGLLPNGGGYQADPCPDCAAPVTAGVPMPKPVAYGFGNTAITGHTNRLMMVRIDIPGGDQYAGAFWLPLVLADEAHAYGVACRAAGEAAGYARGLRDAVRDADIEALRLYVRALCKAVDAATDFAGTVAGGASWWDDVWAAHAAALDRARERISQAALRAEVK